MLSFKTPSCLLWCRKLYSKLKWHGVATPPPKRCTHHPSLLFFYLYICLCTTSQSKEHLVPLGCAVTTLRVPHQRSFHPARREERRAKRAEDEERKSGTNSVSHTHRKSVYAHGKIAAHICGVAMRIHQSPCPDRFTRAYSLTLAPTLIFFTVLQALARGFKL